MRPKEYAKASSTIAYLPGFSAPRGRRCLSRSVRLRRLEKKLRGRRIDEYRNLFSEQIPGALLETSPRWPNQGPTGGGFRETHSRSGP